MNINNCYTGTAIEQLEEGCAGNYTSTDCTQTPNAISYLDLPAGSTQTEINAAITTSLLFKDQQIAEFSSTAIEAGDNIEVTGVGSEENPYVVSSPLQDLQSVVNAGYVLEGDGGISSFQLFGDSPYSRYMSLQLNNGESSPNNRLCLLRAYNHQVLMENGYGTDSGNIGVFNGKTELKQFGNIGYTIVSYQTPLATTTLKFPAKTVNGDYTIPAYPNTTYLVSTLPAGQLNDIAVVTDATIPTYLGVLSGGGTTVTPVWHNGTIWVAR